MSLHDIPNQILQKISHPKQEIETLNQKPTKDKLYFNFVTLKKKLETNCIYEKKQNKSTTFKKYSLQTIENLIFHFDSKKWFKNKLDYSIETIIKEYEKTGKNVFDDFEDIYTFVQKWIEQHIPEKYHHSECLKHKAYQYLMSTDKPSKTMMEEENIISMLEGFFGFKVTTNKKSLYVSLKSRQGTYIRPEELCLFDVFVSCAIISMFEHSFKEKTDIPLFTEIDIAKRLTGREEAKKNTVLLEQILDSMIRLRNIETLIKCDDLKKTGAFPNGKLNIFDRYREWAPLLEIRESLLIAKNGKSVPAYRLYQAPALTIFGEAFNQILRCDTHIFTVLPRADANDIVIMNYLVGEIARNNSPQISLYSTIIRITGQNNLLKTNGGFIDKYKKKGFKEKLNKVFEGWQEMGIIKSFKLHDDRITWIIGNRKKLKEPKYLK